jgi:hypothetical protein
MKSTDKLVSVLFIKTAYPLLCRPQAKPEEIAQQGKPILACKARSHCYWQPVIPDANVGFFNFTVDAIYWHTHPKLQTSDSEDVFLTTLLICTLLSNHKFQVQWWIQRMHPQQLYLQGNLKRPH